MHLAFVAAAVLLLGLAVPAHAQAEEFMPTLTLGSPSLVGGLFVPVETPGTTLEVPWTYTFPAAAAMPVGNTTILWSMECPSSFSIALLGPLETRVAFVPGQQEYSGTASFGILAPREAPGLQAMRCSVTGEAGGAAESLQASDVVETDLTIAFVADITGIAPSAARQGGPQKQIPYFIDVNNLGNTRVQITFEILEQPGGKWNVLPPEVMMLDSPNAGTGASRATAVVTVATPFHNGYNSGSGDFVIRLHTAAADDPDQIGPTIDIPFKATVKGVYIPGPQLPLLLAALGLAVALRARRA